MKELAFGLGFGLFIAVGAAILAILPERGQPVAVFMGPAADRGAGLRAVVAADGVLLNHASVVLAIGEGEDFIERLYGAGAWFVGDARALGLCATGSNGELLYVWN